MNKRVQSNWGILTDSTVVTAGSEGWPRPGPARNSLYLPEGRWVEAAVDFHLPGGFGGGGSDYWKDDGADVKAGQLFRLLSRGTRADAAVWEVAPVYVKMAK